MRFKIFINPWTAKFFTFHKRSRLSTWIFRVSWRDTDANIKDLVEKFVSESLAISEKSFIRMQETYRNVICTLDQAIEAETYKVQLHKATIKHDLPTQIIFWVYSLANMCVLEFYLDFLGKFFDQTKFELSQMGKESLYFAISQKTLETILKPEKRSDYFWNRIFRCHFNTVTTVLQITSLPKLQDAFGN